MRCIYGLLLLLAMTVCAPAQHPSQDQELHDKFYQDWLRPDTGRIGGNRTQSCCNKADCYPTEIKLQGGKWFFKHRETGDWLVIPKGRLEHNQPDPRESPDGGSHVCASAAGDLFCAVLGNQG